MLPVPSSIDRAVARAVDRIEIISPRHDGMRDADTPESVASDSFEAEAWRARAGRRGEERAAWSDMRHATRAAAAQAYAARLASPRFAAQRMAQESFGPGAHLENWRGATRAYATAQSLGAVAASTGFGVSLLV